MTSALTPARSSIASRLSLSLAAVIAAAGCRPVIGQLSVATDFEGGAADVVSFDDERADVTLMPPLRPDRGWPNWWFARIDGVAPGQKLKLHVMPNPQPWRGSAVLARDWALPRQAAISHDGITWTQSDPGTPVDSGSTYQLLCESSSLWAAWGPPFLPSDAEQLIDELAERLPDSEPFLLATTRHGRTVRGIRMGATASADRPVFGVWVQARQHAWEVGSSWVGRGFAEWIAGDDPQAVELRRTTVICYVPLMDVDNVTIGAGGKEAVPRDHNRDWSESPHYPEVAAAQQRILALNTAACFDVFVDLHNPGARESRPYFFGPMNMADLPAQQQHNYARWLAIAEAQMIGPLVIDTRYHFTTYVKTEEELNRMSSNWVRNHTRDHVVSTTLETAWNTPHSNVEGYRRLGAQLGQSIARYVAENPRLKTE